MGSPDLSRSAMRLTRVSLAAQGNRPGCRPEAGTGARFWRCLASAGALRSGGPCRDRCPWGSGRRLPSDEMRLDTALTSILVSSFFSLFIFLATWLMGTWPSPRPLSITWMVTLGRMRARRLRSASSSGLTRCVGPSLTSTTPGRPMARKTASCVRGFTATGWSSVIQPRLSVPRAAPDAPGWFSICANAARSARRDRIRVAARRPSGMPMIRPVIQFSSRKPTTRLTATTPRNASSISHGTMGSWRRVILKTSPICFSRLGFLTFASLGLREKRPRFGASAAGVELLESGEFAIVP